MVLIFYISKTKSLWEYFPRVLPNRLSNCESKSNKICPANRMKEHKPSQRLCAMYEKAGGKRIGETMVGKGEGECFPELADYMREPVKVIHYELEVSLLQQLANLAVFSSTVVSYVIGQKMPANWPNGQLHENTRIIRQESWKTSIRPDSEPSRKDHSESSPRKFFH